MPGRWNDSMADVAVEHCYDTNSTSGTNNTGGTLPEWWLITPEPTTVAILTTCVVISAANMIFGVANLFAVISIATIKKLHTPLNMYAAGIAVVDTVMVTTVLPVHCAQIIMVLQGGAPMPHSICMVTSFLKPFLVVCSCTSKLVIASVQARAVGSSVGHLNLYQVSLREIAIIAAFQVALGLTISVVTVSQDSVGYLCCITFHFVGRLEGPPLMFAKPSSWSTWAIVPIVSGISVTCSLICYAFIYCKLSNNRFPERKDSTDSRLSGKRSKKAELFTVKTAVMLVVVYVICYLPSFTLGIIHPDLRYLSYWYLASTFFEFHSCLSPFVYIWGSPRYRKTVRNELRQLRMKGAHRCSTCAVERSSRNEHASRYNSTNDLDTKELSTFTKLRREEDQKFLDQYKNDKSIGYIDEDTM